MFDCFKKKPQKPIVVNPPKPVVIDKDGEILIALVRGHTRSRSGADNYLRESEFEWSGRIARKMQFLLADKGIRTATIERPDGRSYSSQCRYVAQKCEQLGVKFSIHLHFNAASGNPMGCEVLVRPSHTDVDDRIADFITDELNEKYGFRERHKDGIKTVYSGHNGYGMLDKVGKTGVIPFLIEPCFANWRNRESAMIFEREDEFVAILVDCCERMVKGTLPEVD